MLLGSALAFTGCAGEEEDLFDKSAAVRLNEASELYSSRLEAQPNGWAMQLYPTTQNEAPYGNGYLVLMDFNSDHSVLVAMNNTLTGDSYMEDRSGWEVITDDGPVLTFNTKNSVMHLFSEPEDVSSTGTKDDPNDETGVGIGGDYEFIIVDAPEDASYMMLKGKKRGTYNLLTPVEEGVVYSDYLLDVKTFQQKMFPTTSPTFDVVHFGDQIFKMDGADDGIPNIYPYDGDAVIDESFNPFLITKRGEEYYLRFRDVKNYGDAKVQDFKYDAASDRFVSVDDEKYYISGDDPYRFFSASVSGGSRWQLNNSSARSESMIAKYNEVSNGFRGRKITLNSFMFQSLEEGRMRVSVQYRSGTKTSSANFFYDMIKEDDGIILNYAGAENDVTESLRLVIPGLADFLQFLSQKYTVSVATTGFDLSNVKLISTSDSDTWFVLRLI